MPFTLTMPKLSPTMEEGTLVRWHKKEGDFVEEGDLLFEVATDKATQEYQAIDEGWLRRILVQEGGEAVVNQPLAIFSEKADESIEGYAPPERPKEEKKPAQATKVQEADGKPQAPLKVLSMDQPAFAPEPPLEQYEWSTARQGNGSRVMASPLARRMAKEAGLDLTTLVGTGPGGRIMQRDLNKAQPAGEVAFGRHEAPDLPPGSYEEESLTPMRKAIGKRLQEAKTFIPHFYVRQTIDAEPMIRAREELKGYGVKVTFNDFVIRACALALRKHPVVNSAYNSVNQTIVRFKTVDIAMAVSVDAGLITPILRHADFKNLGQLAVEAKELAGRARAGKLEPHEYRGGSFTVSNLGMYGIDDFVAVINPPQAAILAVGGIIDTPVVRDGQVVPGKRMGLILSSDHRVVDGAAAAEFLRTLKGYLENPSGLLIG